MKRKYKITQKEYDEIARQAEAAQALLADGSFSFVMEYLENAKRSIVDQVVNNRIRDVRERVSIGQTIKEFFTPKEVQIDELAGKYQFIEQFLNDMETYANLLSDLDQKIESKQVEVVKERAGDE